MLSQNIKRLRLEKNLTQEQLASMLGISAQAVSKWETTDTYPDGALLVPLAKALDISLDELAYVAGYSKYHFSRIFRQYNSMSYLQYINARRTKAAEVLLLDPNMPVTEVAMRSGFKSLTTFNRIFKEIKHCTPTDFKKLYAMR